jgi:hypothetical protein
MVHANCTPLVLLRPLATCNEIDVLCGIMDSAVVQQSMTLFAKEVLPHCR